MIRLELTKRDGSVENLDRVLSQLRYKLNHVKNGQYVIEVKGKVRHRTCPQNALYWMWIGLIAEHTGDDAASLHDYFKRTYLPRQFRAVMGRTVEVDITTTTLSTAAFAEYMQKIEAFVQVELGMTLPHPGDNEFTTFYEDFLKFYGR